MFFSSSNQTRYDLFVIKHIIRKTKNHHLANQCGAFFFGFLITAHNIFNALDGRNKVAKSVELARKRRLVKAAMIGHWCRSQTSIFNFRSARNVAIPFHLTKKSTIKEDISVRPSSSSEFVNDRDVLLAGYRTRVLNL